METRNDDGGQAITSESKMENGVLYSEHYTVLYQVLKYLLGRTCMSYVIQCTEYCTADSARCVF